MEQDEAGNHFPTCFRDQPGAHPCIHIFRPNLSVIRFGADDKPIPD